MKSKTAIVRELVKRESRFHRYFGAEELINKEIYNIIMKEGKTHAKRDSLNQGD